MTMFLVLVFSILYSSMDCSEDYSPDTNDEASKVQQQIFDSFKNTQAIHDRVFANTQKQAYETSNYYYIPANYFNKQQLSYYKIDDATAQDSGQYVRCPKNLNSNAGKDNGIAIPIALDFIINILSQLLYFYCSPINLLTNLSIKIVFPQGGPSEY